jgi:hypothetical protein
MTRFTKILAAAAVLMTGLAPIAANAAIATPLDHVQIEAHKAMSGPLPEVQHVSADATQKLAGQTIVRSGAVAQRYTASVGG